jgi:hypothetical protein
MEHTLLNSYSKFQSLIYFIYQINITILTSKIKLRQGHIHTHTHTHTLIHKLALIYTLTLELLEILRSELDINITGEVNTFERTLHISHNGGLRSTHAYLPLRDRRQHT